MRKTIAIIIASSAFVLFGCHLDEHYDEYENEPDPQEHVIGERAEDHFQAAAAEEGHGPLEQQIRGQKAERQAELHYVEARDQARAEAEHQARVEARTQAQARPQDVVED